MADTGGQSRPDRRSIWLVRRRSGDSLRLASSTLQTARRTGRRRDIRSHLSSHACALPRQSSRPPARRKLNGGCAASFADPVQTLSRFQDRSRCRSRTSRCQPHPRKMPVDACGIFGHARQLLLWRQYLPNSQRRLFCEVCPLIAQEDERVWFEADPDRALRGLGSLSQSIDTTVINLQADGCVLAPVNCEQLAWVQRFRPIFPRLVWSPAKTGPPNSCSLRRDGVMAPFASD